MTSSNINLPEFSVDDFYDFSKDTLLIGKLFKKSNRELKKIKQEKESLILQLLESHVLIDSLKSENTMLFDTIDALENKLKESEDLLKKLSSNNLKSMLCIHIDISNKPDIEPSRPDDVLIQERFLPENFEKSCRTVVRPDGHGPPSGRLPGIFLPDAHSNPQPINRGPWALRAARNRCEFH
jgi:hypothetical protein